MISRRKWRCFVQVARSTKKTIINQRIINKARENSCLSHSLVVSGSSKDHRDSHARNPAERAQQALIRAPNEPCGGLPSRKTVIHSGNERRARSSPRHSAFPVPTRCAAIFHAEGRATRTRTRTAHGAHAHARRVTVRTLRSRKRHRRFASSDGSDGYLRAGAR